MQKVRNSLTIYTEKPEGWKAFRRRATRKWNDIQDDLLEAATRLYETAAETRRKQRDPVRAVIVLMQLQDELPPSYRDMIYKAVLRPYEEDGVSRVKLYKPYRRLHFPHGHSTVSETWERSDWFTVEWDMENERCHIEFQTVTKADYQNACVDGFIVWMLRKAPAMTESERALRPNS